MAQNPQTCWFYFLLPKVGHVLTGMAYAGKAEKQFKGHMFKSYF